MRNMNLIHSFKIPKSDALYQYSNPAEAQRQAFRYLGEEGNIYKSMNPKKKYMIFNPNTQKWVYFGQMDPPMEDFLKHKDTERRMKYLRRAIKIKGDWEDDPFSPNNLSIHILW